MPRRLKQLIYGVMFLAFWGAVFYGIYFIGFRPEPSCFDGAQNQGEEGVDCGGPCAAFCIPELVPPRVPSGAQVLTYSQNGSTITSIIAEIQNPNQNHGAEALPYTITLLDAAGAQIDQIRGETFIYPRQVKYIVHPNVDVDTPIASAGITLGVPEWVPGEVFARPNLEVRQISTEVDSSGIAARGVLANLDVVPLENVQLTAIFYSRFGRALAVSTSQLVEIRSGASTPFAVLHPPISGVDPSRTEVLVEARRPR